MINTAEMWPTDFGLDKVQSQTLFGHGLWPFALSIILFSLVIDKIGYRIAMIFSFICYGAYAVLALQAHGARPVAECGLLAAHVLQQCRAGVAQALRQHGDQLDQDLGA